MKQLTIAIDGTAGSGKSTLAKSLAQKLNYLYIDTGAMYRALTYKAISANIDLADTEKLSELAETVKISLRKIKGNLRVFAADADVTDKIRLPEVSNAVSRVAAVPGVRRQMVQQQQELGRNGGVVLEGRDIGTVVFPNAEIKFFLKAEVTERTKRRYQELKDTGIKAELAEVARNLIYRDQKDSSRNISPLKPAPDAVIIDTSGLTMSEKDEIAWRYIEKRLR